MLLLLFTDTAVLEPCPVPPGPAGAVGGSLPAGKCVSGLLW